MAYIDELLGQGERVLVVERRDPLFLLGRIILFILAAAILIGLGAWLGISYSEFAWLIAVLAIVPIAIALYKYLAWMREQYVVTNYRIVQVEGIINKRILDSSLEKVNDILLTQSAFGRIFNYGTLEILTGSEIGVNRLDALNDPFRFKRAILDARNQHVLGASESQSTRFNDVQEDKVQLLTALNQLRDAGMLTEAEYRAKRDQLLGTQSKSR